MSHDPITTLARSNPVPESVTPAPIEHVLRRIRDEAGPHPRISPRSSHGRTLRFAIPMAVAGVALAVVAGAVLFIHRSGNRAAVAPATGKRSAIVPRRTVAPARGGMRGTVYIDGIALASRRDVVVSLQQCLPCSGARQRTRNYLATTRTAGRDWQVTATPYNLEFPEFTNGRDGWSFGVSASREALYFVSHNGGAGWAPAHLDDGEFPYTTPPAVADGTVWAIANRCASTCTYAVMRGAAAQSTLSPTGGQPDPGAETMAITAGSATTAYATTTYDGGRRERIYATRNSGRTWSQIAPACRSGAPIAAAGDAVWTICVHHIIAASSDGGRHWQRHAGPHSTISQLVPVSATTAWATSRSGALLRTTDGGRSWRRDGAVLGGTASSTGPGASAPLSALSAQSAAAADDYRTADGTDIVVRAVGLGRTTSFIILPRGLNDR